MMLDRHMAEGRGYAGREVHVYVSYCADPCSDAWGASLGHLVSPHVCTPHISFVRNHLQHVPALFHIGVD